MVKYSQYEIYERKEYNMKLDTNMHSVFLLNYHLILVVKYRKQVFDDTISKRAKEIFEYISPNYNISLEEWNHDKDHVHIMFKAHPNSEISKFINAYKSASNRLIKKEYPKIREKLWKEYFWSQSFCLIIAGGSNYRSSKKIYRKSRGKVKQKGEVVMANIAYKYRIYPNKGQKEIFAKTFGCVRFVYNKMLYEKKDHYEKTKENLKITPAKYKKEYEFLKEVDSLALANARNKFRKSI